MHPKAARLQLDPRLYESLRQQVLCRERIECHFCGLMSNLEVHHKEFRSHSSDDSQQSLITLCTACHAGIHH
jgi:5-methylcytosine-specific restriction endonuclease McrA